MSDLVLAFEPGLTPAQFGHAMNRLRVKFSPLGLLLLAVLVPFVRGQTWVSTGPNGVPIPSSGDIVTGQMNAIAVDPTDANTIFVGASEGGLWKTTDGGSNWSQLTDSFALSRSLVSTSGGTFQKATLSIGALAINPQTHDSVYVGTGDPNVACCFDRQVFGPALGVFRGDKEGTVWTPLGDVSQPGCSANKEMSNRTVYRLAIRPASFGVPGTPATIYAATDAGLFSYLEDGTDCWNPVTDRNSMLPTSGASYVSDLIIDSSGVLYAGVSGEGIFSSVGGDDTVWQDVTPVGARPSGRITLALARDASVLYAGVESPNATGSFYRLFGRDRQKGSWGERLAPPSNGQLNFNAAIAVGAAANSVYIGQIGLWHATDGGAVGGCTPYPQQMGSDSDGSCTNFAPNAPTGTGQSWTNIGCCSGDGNPAREGDLNVHADIHAIVFAPAGSFTPSSTVKDIVYIASDGGITKGVLDEFERVSWQSLNNGLTLGQCGSVGFGRGQVTCGFWHNGNAISNDSGGHWSPFGGGDGAVTNVDSGRIGDVITTAYYTCNAGVSGDICRSKIDFNTQALGLALTKDELIWPGPSVASHFSDPYRPGHLFRQEGDGFRIYRTVVADNAAASELMLSTDWAISDPVDAMGNRLTQSGISTMIVQNPPPVDVPNPAPVYFEGTFNGEIWRGSPEVPWTKLCTCSANLALSIATDFINPDRIAVLFGGQSSPGRIKELTGVSSGNVKVVDIDNGFQFPIPIDSLTSVVIDPTDPNTVFVGTDQGVVRGQFVSGSWVWTRSAFPPVLVRDLKTSGHFDAFTSGGVAGVILAGTYGRGVFELQRPDNAPATLLRTVRQLSAQPALAVLATEIGEDGVAPSLNVTINGSISIATTTAAFTDQSPFQRSIAPGSTVTLNAPNQIQIGDEILQFAGWNVANPQTTISNPVTFTVSGDTKALAYYVLKQRIPDTQVIPLQVSVSTNTAPVCVQGLSHNLTVSWSTTGGQLPANVRADITDPAGHVLTYGLKTTSGSKVFPLRLLSGGRLNVKMIATDWTSSNSSAESIVMLQACKSQTCDVDADGKIDRYDINAILSARNKPAADGDSRDANGDHMITVDDARICTLRCTKPGCAP
jgi:hypothetical protein